MVILSFRQRFSKAIFQCFRKMLYGWKTIIIICLQEVPAISTRQRKLIVKKEVSPQKKFFYVSPYNHQMVYADKYEGNGVLTTKLPDAPAYLANSFRTTLVKSGIPVTGKSNSENDRCCAGKQKNAFSV